MRARPVYLVDLIGAVVENTNTAVIADLKIVDPLITEINYQYGSYKEVVDTLTQMTVVNEPKYPLFWLYMPFEEDRGNDIGFDQVDRISIIIAMWSDPVQKASERYANNFKKILYPVYLEFLNQLDLDPNFSTVSNMLIPHKKTDWPYWGGDNPPENANPFNDWVDIIEIKNLNLKTLIPKC